MTWHGYDAALAQDYEADPDHFLPAKEAEWWAQTLTGLGVAPGARVLDLGAGTGQLISALRSRGFDVTGLEPSAAMVAKGLALRPDLKQDDFILAPAGSQAPIPPDHYDAVVSRQMVCHLDAPGDVFSALRDWLSPGGVVVIVDGFWPRSSWPADAHARQPFASLTDSAPLRDALQNAGLTEVRDVDAQTLNASRDDAPPGAARRYGVTARRPREKAST